jgi:hypothetical protein
MLGGFRSGGGGGGYSSEACTHQIDHEDRYDEPGQVHEEGQPVEGVARGRCLRIFIHLCPHARDRSQDQLSTDLRFVGLRRCADTVDVLIVADHCPKAGKHGVPCMHRRRCTLHVWGQSMASSAPHWLRRRTHRERDTGASRNGEHVPTGAIGGVVLEDTYREDTEGWRTYAVRGAEVRCRVERRGTWFDDGRT